MEEMGLTAVKESKPLEIRMALSRLNLAINRMEEFIIDLIDGDDRPRIDNKKAEELPLSFAAVYNALPEALSSEADRIDNYLGQLKNMLL